MKRAAKQKVAEVGSGESSRRGAKPPRALPLSCRRRSGMWPSAADHSEAAAFGARRLPSTGLRRHV